MAALPSAPPNSLGIANTHTATVVACTASISPGQKVAGYELLRVERERVELERGGRTFWLRIR